MTLTTLASQLPFVAMEGVCGRELLNEKVLSSLYALSIYIVLCSSIAIFLRALFNHKIQTWDTMRWIRFFFSSSTLYDTNKGLSADKASPNLTTHCQGVSWPCQRVLIILLIQTFHKIKYIKKMKISKLFNIFCTYHSFLF